MRLSVISSRNFFNMRILDGSLGLFARLKSGLTPSKKSMREPNVSWQASTVKASPAVDTKATTCGSIFRPSSYATAVSLEDGKSLAYSTSLTSSLSPQSELGIINLPGWAKENASDSDPGISCIRHECKSPMPSFALLAKLPYSPSPVKNLRNRRDMYQRRKNYFRYCDGSSIDSGNISCGSSEDGYDHYTFDLNNHYELAFDNDLAIERKRYYENGKRVHIDGVEITAEEEEFTKGFNRKKLDRRHRLANRRKAGKKAFGALGKKNKKDGVLKIKDEFQNLHL